MLSAPSVSLSLSSLCICRQRIKFHCNRVATYSQLHQQFTSSFCTDISFAKKFLSKIVIREKLGKALSYKKVSRKMLMNWHLQSVSEVRTKVNLVKLARLKKRVCFGRAPRKMRVTIYKSILCNIFLKYLLVSSTRL